MKPIRVIKLGGSILKSEAAMQTVAEKLAKNARELGPLVIVHGGGPQINEELTHRGITWSFHDGQRITTPEMMDTIEMVLCGSVNQKLVRAFVKAGAPAVGLSGVDSGLLQCELLSPLYGQVGKVMQVRAQAIHALCAAGFIPVIAPVGVLANSGTAVNINADWAASRIAQALHAAELHFLTDQPGILDAHQVPMESVSTEDLYAAITDGTVQGGMKVKVQTILSALENGVDAVWVGQDLAQAGTRCVCEEAVCA